MSQSGQQSSAGSSVQTPSLITTALLVIAIIFPIFSTAAVVLRICSRRLKSHMFKGDDWAIIFALLMFWAQSINVFVAAGKGGINITTLPPLEAASIFVECLWIEGFFLNVGLPAIKISVLLFYVRIFTLKSFRWAVYIACAVLTGWGISTFITQLLAADPIDSVYNPGKPQLRYNYQAFALSIGGMSLIFDVMILLFPLPVIKNLHMPDRKKLQVIGIFWLAGFCCVAAAVRVYYLQAKNPAAASKAYGPATNAFIWAHVEPHISIVAACLPTFGPLFASGGPSPLSKLRSRVSSLMKRSRLGEVDSNGRSPPKHFSDFRDSGRGSNQNKSFGKLGRKTVARLGTDDDEDGHELIFNRGYTPNNIDHADKDTNHHSNNAVRPSHLGHSSWTSDLEDGKGGFVGTQIAAQLHSDFAGAAPSFANEQSDILVTTGLKTQINLAPPAERPS